MTDSEKLPEGFKKPTGKGVSMNMLEGDFAGRKRLAEENHAKTTEKRQQAALSTLATLRSCTPVERFKEIGVAFDHLGYLCEHRPGNSDLIDAIIKRISNLMAGLNV